MNLSVRSFVDPLFIDIRAYLESLNHKIIILFCYQNGVVVDRFFSLFGGGFVWHFYCLLSGRMLGLVVPVGVASGLILPIMQDINVILIMTTPT